VTAQRPSRNYRVVGLVEREGVLLVQCEREDGSRFDAGTPSEFGTWGLLRSEAAIVRRGLTSSGRDRRPPNGS
jgi:hypothetical protein